MPSHISQFASVYIGTCILYHTTGAFLPYIMQLYELLFMRTLKSWNGEVTNNNPETHKSISHHRRANPSLIALRRSNACLGI
jgi:hypothetical protein